MRRLALCLLGLTCGLLCAQTPQDHWLANEIRNARMRLKTQSSSLSEVELDRLAETIGRSNYLARAIPEALRRNDLTNAERLLAQFPGSINELKTFGQPILYQPVLMGNEATVAFLLKHKADPNQAAPGGQPLLYQAIQMRRWPIALQLIEGGASVIQTNLWGQGPLGVLVENLWMVSRPNDPSCEVLQQLLDRGADPFAAARSRETASLLERVLERGQDLATADLLLTNRPDAARRTPGGETALHLAVLWGRTNALDFLLKSGFSIDQTNSDGLTPLQRIAGSPLEANFVLVKTNGSWSYAPPAPAGSGPRFVSRPRAIRVMIPWQGLNVRPPPGAIAAELLNRGARLDVFCAAGLGLTNELAQMLRSQPKLVGARDPLGRTPLHYAAGSMQFPAAELLVRAGSPLSVQTVRPISGVRPGETIPPGVTPLHLAALQGSDSLLALLLRAGAKVQLADQVGDTALHLNARVWETNCLALLLSAHASLEATNSAGRTPVQVAVQSGIAPAVEFLLKAGARRRIGPGGETLLHLAASSGSAEVCKVLLRSGLALDARDSLGRTPFYLAALAHKWDVLNLLAGKGADVNMADAQGNTVLHQLATQQDDTVYHNAQLPLWERWKQQWLARPGPAQQALAWLIARRWLAPTPSVTWTNTSLTAWLLEHRARVDATNCLGQTPLALLCRQSWLGFSSWSPTNRVTALLQAGAKVQSTDTQGVSCLHVAATNAPPAMLALLARRAPPGQALADAHGRTPLHYAARPLARLRDDAAARVAALLEGGLNPNATDEQGRAPLHDAVLAGLEYSWAPTNGILLALLTNHANPNIQDRQGLTPLHLAVKGWNENPNGASSGIWGDAALLLAYHADPNLPDRQGRTPLHCLAEACRNSGVMNSSLNAVLLAARWDPTIRDKTGQAPIHLLASNFYPYSVPSAGFKHLLTNQAALNLTNAAGDTPLHLAIRADRYYVAKLLLEAGANPSLRNARGESAWRLAAAAEPGGMMAQTVQPPGAHRSFFHAISTRDQASFDRWVEADPAVCSVTNVHGQTPLMAATEQPGNPFTQRLLDLGAPLDPLSALRLDRLAEFQTLLQSHTGPIPTRWLFEAVRLDHLEALQQMVAAGADVQTVDDGGHSLLYRASTGNSPAAKWLVSQGCRKTVFDAVVQGDKARLEQFLGADAGIINAPNRQGRTLLMQAAIAKQPDLAALLLARGAAITNRTPEGWTALHFAAAKGQMETGARLLHAGADPNALAAGGMGPLHIAAAFGQAEFAGLLLTNGAQVNLRPSAIGSFGNTPLHWAVQRGRIEAVKVLLAHGADPNAANQFRLTPLGVVSPDSRTPHYGFPTPFELWTRPNRPPSKAQRAALRQLLEGKQERNKEPNPGTGLPMAN